MNPGKKSKILNLLIYTFETRPVLNEFQDCSTRDSRNNFDRFSFPFLGFRSQITGLSCNYCRYPIGNKGLGYKPFYRNDAK